MYICLECGRLFSEPKHYTERHGFDTPPYEKLSGCPGCGGNFASAYQCDECGEWITDDYVKVDDMRYCSNCYIRYDLGEED